MEQFEEQYLKKFGNLIPMFEVRTNDVLYQKFDGLTEEVYRYCLEKNKKWEEVLKPDVSNDINVLY